MINFVNGNILTVHITVMYEVPMVNSSCPEQWAQVTRGGKGAGKGQEETCHWSGEGQEKGWGATNNCIKRKNIDSERNYL